MLDDDQPPKTSEQEQFNSLDYVTNRGTVLSFRDIRRTVTWSARCFWENFDSRSSRAYAVRDGRWTKQVTHTTLHRTRARLNTWRFLQCTFRSAAKQRHEAFAVANGNRPDRLLATVFVKVQDPPWEKSTHWQFPKFQKFPKISQVILGEIMTFRSFLATRLGVISLKQFWIGFKPTTFRERDLGKINLRIICALPSNVKLRFVQGNVHIRDSFPVFVNPGLFAGICKTTQNRRQKVFNRGALGLCGGLHTLKIDKISTDL